MPGTVAESPGDSFPTSNPGRKRPLPKKTPLDSAVVSGARTAARVCVQAQSHPPNWKAAHCRESVLQPEETVLRLEASCCVHAGEHCQRVQTHSLGETQAAAEGRTTPLHPPVFHEASTAAPLLHASLSASVLTRSHESGESPCFSYHRRL